MVIEYEPSACFQKFGKLVSDARREGDQNPDKAILAETMKLIRNSSYGKTITPRLFKAYHRLSEMSTWTRWTVYKKQLYPRTKLSGKS